MWGLPESDSDEESCKMSINSADNESGLDTKRMRVTLKKRKKKKYNSLEHANNEHKMWCNNNDQSCLTL